MAEVDCRSLRILVDLQACQTHASANRGVGRYSKALFESLNSAAGERRLFGLVSAEHSVFPEFNGLTQTRMLIAPSLPDWQTKLDFRGGDRDSIDALLHSAVAAVVAPDIVHVSNIFEGIGERVAIPDPINRPAGQVHSATLFDLIPLRFKDLYFESADYTGWYYHRLKYLQQADLLLSISESSRRDAIELLGLDPAKIVTIHGGIASCFKPVLDRDAVRAHLRCKYALGRPGIVLYVGGDDYRKNLAGAIAGFAALPAEIRKTQQLVVVCALEEQRKKALQLIAENAGLTREDVCFPGFIPEDDLVAFYSACDVFFYPSLYEGLGLPVLEAMACGAAVICAGNSSLPEVAPTRNALFDAARPESIAERLRQVIENRAFADDLRVAGVARAKEFTWQKTAARALEAFDEALARKRRTGALAASQGWLPKPRLAVLGPLPPCRSGVADYSAQFLPYLAAHFDVDLYVNGYTVSDERLNAAFRIFDASDFRNHAASYDAILYEFGNSEFHAHMVPLLAEYPGVVGLHDVFLSGLMGYLAFDLGEPARFGREMLYSHGGQARRLLAPIEAHPDSVRTAIVELPCTKSVLDNAIGIIGHSTFILDATRKFYPQGWLAPFRVIPQMVVPPEIPETGIRGRILGIDSGDFVVATFGHITWTKLGDLLLRAFLESVLAQNANCHLVFVGELPGDEFGATLKTLIENSPCRSRIRITGFLSEDQYRKILRRADVAVQLRTSAREGASKAVLDCLAAAVPTIVYDVGCFSEFPDEVVIKLSPDGDGKSLTRELEKLWADPDRRRRTAGRGPQYVREQHDPERCAAQYAAAIHEFMARDLARKASSYAPRLAPHLVALADPVNGARLAADYLDSRPAPGFARARLFVDVSYIAQVDHKTGIQRVVKEIVHSTYCSRCPGIEAVAVERIGDRMVPALNWLKQQRLLLPHEIAVGKADPIEFSPGDHLLMLDSSWDRFEQFDPIFAAARAARATVTTVVYDLLPVTLPSGNFVEGGREWFERWLRRAITVSDGLVCISRSVADDVIRYIGTNDLGRPGLKVGWWRLGSTPSVTADLPPDRSIRQAATSPFALMVGTIEPRKNHALALDAFERLWADGSDVNLVIAGRPGWLIDDVLERLRTHPLRNTRLFFFEQASDHGVHFLYRHAVALLMISRGEGFGLPLVEAARWGTPVICSDLPVFREVAEDHAIYVDVGSLQALTGDLSTALQRVEDGTFPRSSDMQLLSWEDSADALLRIVHGQDWYWTR
jgi:glycosyltransferase involved in cell wall biosynthesis